MQILTDRVLNMDTVEYAEKRGSEMFRDGAIMSDNPYDRDKSPDLFDAWNTGFKLEQDYWEGEL
ncbi:MAG: hypothetical protein KBC53_07190 [Nitrosomonas sp.]|nr:hypothetical protein [Nitrosomonas sp.]MBX9636720.1 hypothetical protein [Nitrosomonas sp.]